MEEAAAAGPGTQLVKSRLCACLSVPMPYLFYGDGRGRVGHHAQAVVLDVWLLVGMVDLHAGPLGGRDRRKLGVVQVQ